MSSTGTPQHTFLANLHLEAASDLLSNHSLQARVVAASAVQIAPSKPSYISLLGATGQGIAFSSILNIHTDLLIRLHPLGLSNVSDADLADWCRELNNQVVGRMKNKLFRYGISVALGLPVLLTGTGIKAVSSPDVVVNRHSLETPSGSIELSLETFLDPALEFSEQESLEDESAMPEGALALF